MGNLVSSTNSGTGNAVVVDLTVPLSVLLDAPLGQVNWDQVRGVLQHQEEQCAAYAYGYDPSPLCRAVAKQCPIDILMTMVSAYPDALDQVHPQTGDTILHIAVKKQYPLQPQQEHEQQQQQQQQDGPQVRRRQAQQEDDDDHDGNAAIEEDNADDENDLDDHHDDDPYYVARVEYLLLQRPLLAQTRNERNGWLPIHEPTIGHVNVVDLLDKYNPGCITQKLSKNGRLPLHQILSLSLIQQQQEQQLQPQRRQRHRHQPCIAVIQRMVQLSSGRPASSSKRTASIKPLAQGGILMRDKQGQSPLELLCCHLTACGTASTGDDAGTDGSEVTETALSPYGSRLWKQVLLDWIRMIMTRQEQASIDPSKQNHNSDRYELHTLIELGCLISRPLIEQAIRYDLSHQATLRDNQGKTPLHIAAASTQRVIKPNSECHDDNDDTATTTPTVEDFLISTLIEQNPQAPRMTDYEGRLPIDYAAECGKTCVQGLARLIQSEPRAVDTRDLRDHNYPFIAAALASSSNGGARSGAAHQTSTSSSTTMASSSPLSSSPPSYTTNSLSATYFLLRAKPHVLSYYHTP